MSEPLIKLINVSQTYNGNAVLHDINLEIMPRSITTVIGPNGAGKTTLARLILGIEQPTSGTINKKPGIRISYIPQKLALDKNLPLDIKSFLKILSQKNYSDHSMQEVLIEVGLNMSADVSVHSLSGGQFQKLLLAAALLNKPELIVMDEATQNLDISSQANFYKIIERIKAEHKCAIFMISHDLFTVMTRSEQVICLNQHICCKGEPGQVLDNPEYIKIFGRKENILSIYSHNHDHHHN